MVPFFRVAGAVPKIDKNLEEELARYRCECFEGTGGDSGFSSDFVVFGFRKGLVKFGDSGGG